MATGTINLCAVKRFCNDCGAREEKEGTLSMEKYEEVLQETLDVLDCMAKTCIFS